MPNVMSSACTPGLNCLETSGKKPMKHGGAPLPVQGASAEKNHWWAYLRKAFASRPTTHRWNFVNNECQTTPGGAPLPVQGAPAEKNHWWAYLRQAFASRPTTHRWNFVNNECQTTPGGAPLPVQGAPAEKNRGARWACLTGRPSSTSPETIRRRPH